MPKQWFNIVNQAGVPQIKIFGDIGTDENEVDYESFRTEFMALEQQYSTIELCFHCNGGSMLEGWAIVDLLLNTKAHTIGTVEGMAASMGGALFLACKERRMMANAMLMIHRPQAVFAGEAEGMEGMVSLLKDMETKVVAFYAKQTGQPETTVKSWLQPGKMTWVNAATCKQYGISHKTIDGNGISNAAPSITNKKPSEVFEIYNQLNQNKPETMNKFKTWVMAKLMQFNITNSLNDNSDEQAVINEAEKLFKHQQDEITRLTNELKAASTDKVKNLIDTAKSEGKITDEQVANWTKLAESDFDTVKNTFAAMTGKPVENKPATVDLNAHLKTSPAGTQPAPSAQFDVKNKATWDMEAWQKHDPAGLAKMKREEWDKYAGMFKAQYGVEPDKN